MGAGGPRERLPFSVPHAPRDTSHDPQPGKSFAFGALATVTLCLQTIACCFALPKGHRGVAIAALVIAPPTIYALHERSWKYCGKGVPPLGARLAVFLSPIVSLGAIVWLVLRG